MPDPVTKRCSQCGEVKPLDEFHRHARMPDGRAAACKECRTGSSRRYYEANREARLAYAKRSYAANVQAMHDRQRGYREANRAAVLDHYGRSCACCGSTDDLTIDHVNGDGAQHRRELYGDPQRGLSRFYMWLIKHGFPAEYQTLCRACNSSKRSTAHCRLNHSLPA